MQCEIIIDTETTGLNPKQGHRIIEIAGIKMVNKCLTGQKLRFYVNPERDVPDESYRIHGISGEFLKDKPLFAEIADQILDFFEGATKIVAHNAQFDIDFINHELSLLNKPSLTGYEVVDTLELAREKFPGMRNNLDILCKRFDIDNSGRALHGALKDAALLAEVYVELLGGRQASFDIESQDQKDNLSNTENKHNANIKTKILPPTKEEIAKHNDFIKEFCKNPLWARK